MDDEGIIHVPDTIWDHVIQEVEHPNQSFYNSLYLDVSALTIDDGQTPLPAFPIVPTKVQIGDTPGYFISALLSEFELVGGDPLATVENSVAYTIPPKSYLIMFHLSSYSENYYESVGDSAKSRYLTSLQSSCTYFRVYVNNGGVNDGSKTVNIPTSYITLIGNNDVRSYSYRWAKVVQDVRYLFGTSNLPPVNLYAGEQWCVCLRDQTTDTNYNSTALLLQNYELRQLPYWPQEFTNINWYKNTALP